MMCSKTESYKPYAWWATHRATCPILQQLIVRLLYQVTSSSCCKRNLSTYENLYNLTKIRLEQSKAKTMVYDHTNLHLIYKQREEWLKGKTKIWDVFPDDRGLDNSVKLGLANLMNQDRTNYFWWWWSSWGVVLHTNICRFGLGTEEEEDEGENNDSGGDFDDFNMEEDYWQWWAMRFFHLRF